MIVDSMIYRKVRLIAVAALVVGATACSSSPDAEGVADGAPEVVPVEDVTVASPTATEPAEPSVSPTTPSPSETEDATMAGPSDEPSDSVLTEGAAGRELGLGYFFRPDYRWSEQLYDIARERDVTGIGTTIRNCWDDGIPLEIRLGNDFSTFGFSAGQSNISESSAETVTIQVEGNGNTLDIKRVPFNQIEEVLVDVSGVNALRINVSLDEELSECDTADIVLFNIKAE